MIVRIEFPFYAQFELPDVGTNSREVRSQILQNYLLNCGMELGSPIEEFQVSSFRGDDNGEFWEVRTGNGR
jgi:hypothetical protein